MPVRTCATVTGSVAAGVLLLCSPAPAVTVAGGRAGVAGEDASMCFDVHPPMLAAGTATATGAVTTNPVPSLDVSWDPATARGRLDPPTTLVADVRPLATTTGYGSVCVGGVGARATGGSVTFTLNLHGVGADYAVVTQCAYRADSPPLCA